MINIYALTTLAFALFLCFQIYEVRLHNISNVNKIQDYLLRSNIKSSYILIFLFLIVTQSAYLNYETIDWDTNSYLVSSQDILRGNLPYETQWESKQVLFYYFYAILIKLSTGNLIAFKLLNDLILFAIVGVLYVLIESFTKSSFKALFSSLFYLSIMSQPWASAEFSEIYSLFFISIAYYFLAIKKITNKTCFYMGLLLSCASLINIGSALFTIPFVIHLFFTNRKKIILFIFGTSVLHIFFFIIYFAFGQLDVYWSTLFTIPNAYRGESMNLVKSVIDFLRSLYEFNIWIYLGLIFLSVSLFIDFIKFDNLKNKLKFFKTPHLYFLLTSIVFYYLASHGYYHHLIFFIYFFPFLIVNQRQPLSNILFSGIIFLGVASGISSVASTSISNLQNLDVVYSNYPLKKLSSEIDNQFNDDYSILALDTLLVLYYLDKPNFSYIVHPSNHNEEFITDNLKKIGKVKDNEPKRLVELEPDVIICSNNTIIHCEIYDYKTNYFELDALQYRQDPNLQFYDNQTYHFRVFIKES